MFQKKMLFFPMLLALTTLCISAKPVDLSTLSGSWHLRVMDGNDVRKARAILDFHADKMLLSGFDGCNRITGTLKKDTNSTFSTMLISTKMACRQNIHRYVSQRLHETVNGGFTIQEEKKYGIEGITLKSAHHELFFKHMEKDSKWF